MKENERMYTREELEPMIPKMTEASSVFYGAATRIGNHAFIEFCGLMNEYIAMCRTTMEANQDFTCANVHVGQALVAKDYQVKYLAEKFECIFGPIFADPKNRLVFEQAMGWKHTNIEEILAAGS